MSTEKQKIIYCCNCKSQSSYKRMRPWDTLKKDCDHDRGPYYKECDHLFSHYYEDCYS